MVIFVLIFNFDFPVGAETCGKAEKLSWDLLVRDVSGSNLWTFPGGLDALESRGDARPSDCPGSTYWTLDKVPEAFRTDFDFIPPDMKQTLRRRNRNPS